MKLQNRALAWRLTASTSLIACVTLTACGGGGSGAESPKEVTAQPSAGAHAQVLAAKSAEASWQIETSLSASLTDPAGKPISNTLSCEAEDARLAIVAVDCSKIRVQRLGAVTIVVKGGGYSAKATMTGVPAPQWSGVHGPASTAGYGDDVLVRLGDGRVLAWGGNPGGVLGQNKGGSSLTKLVVPTAVLDSNGTAALKNIYRVSAGYSAAVAVTREGGLMTWGTNNSHQLGNDNPAYVNGSLLPISVPAVSAHQNLEHVVQAENGDEGAMALIDDGTVVGWGNWPADGTASSSALPAGILRPDGKDLLRDVVSISAGRTFYLALGSDGSVYAWGNSMINTGNLGDGLLTSRQMKTPVVVQKEDGSPLTDIVQISAGYAFSLALDRSGQVWAWGENTWGQLGQGKTSPSVGISRAVPVMSSDGKTPLRGIQMVAAGGIHALALGSDGTVLAWGRGEEGQLGDGANRPAGTQATLPRVVVNTEGLPGLSNVMSIAAGNSHSQALTTDGRVLTWGSNSQGSLGRVTAKPQDGTPAPVIGEGGAGLLTLRVTDYANPTNRGR
jgi:alpha-tubulin suppressor-like RCC1 family protein